MRHFRRTLSVFVSETLSFLILELFEKVYFRTSVNKQKVLMYYLKKKLRKKTKTELFEIAKVKHFCLLAGMKISGFAHPPRDEEV